MCEGGGCEEVGEKECVRVSYDWDVGFVRSYLEADIVSLSVSDMSASYGPLWVRHAPYCQPRLQGRSSPMYLWTRGP